MRARAGRDDRGGRARANFRVAAVWKLFFPFRWFPTRFDSVFAVEYRPRVRRFFFFFEFFPVLVSCRVRAFPGLLSKRNNRLAGGPGAQHVSSAAGVCPHMTTTRRSRWALRSSRDLRFRPKNLSISRMPRASSRCATRIRGVIFTIPR